jgi:integrase
VSLLINCHTDPKSIQSLAGHASIQTTFNIYGHLMPGFQQEAARKLDGLLEDGVGEV